MFGGSDEPEKSQSTPEGKKDAAPAAKAVEKKAETPKKPEAPEASVPAAGGLIPAHRRTQGSGRRRGVGQRLEPLPDPQTPSAWCTSLTDTAPADVHHQMEQTLSFPP